MKSKNSFIKFLKTRKVKSPMRANQYDAGIDFFIPEFTDEFIEILKNLNPNLRSNIHADSVYLYNGDRILIPSGIHCKMETPNRALIAFNKSGIASKLGLVMGSSVIDFEYQGEIHLNLINTSADGRAVRLEPGMKVVQFIELPIYQSSIDIDENSDTRTFFDNTTTTRGAGGFGSTDSKE